jgi:hypothetical protein
MGGQLRLRRTATGVNGGSFIVTVRLTDGQSFTADATAGTGATVNGLYRQTPLTQNQGRVGVGVMDPQNVMDIVTGNGSGVANEANCIRLRNSVVDGDAMTLQMGATNAAAGGPGGGSNNQGYAYLQGVFWGGGNDTIALNPQGGGVAVGPHTAYEALDVQGNIRSRAPADAPMSEMGRFAFGEANSLYGNSPAYIAGIYDKSNPFYGSGITLNTVANADTSGSNGIERMRITSDGNVGIGTSAPDKLLSVNGDASKVGSSSWATFSDERLKNIKGGFVAGIDELMQIAPIRYRYKRNNPLGIRDEHEHVGVSAQQIERVLPEAVSKNAKGYRMVDNDPIIWTMLNAIKQQQAQMQAQKARIESLESQVRALTRTHR